MIGEEVINAEQLKQRSVPLFEGYDGKCNYKRNRNDWLALHPVTGAVVAVYNTYVGRSQRYTWKKCYARSQ